MVFHDDVQTVRLGVLADTSQSVRGEFLLFGEFASALCVDANRVTAECFGGVDPLVVVLDGLGAFVGVGIAKTSFAIDHDQQTLHAVVVAALLQVCQVSSVFGFVFEKLIDVLNRFDPEFFFGDFGEVQVGDVLGFVSQGAMQ